MAALQNLQGLIGMAAILLLAWALSEDRKARPGWRWIGGALLLQFAIALAVTRVPFVWTVVGYANKAVSAIEAATLVGSSYMFGYIGGAPIPFLLKPGAEAPVIVAFQILPLIIVFSAISALLWHWGVLRAVVRGLSWALQRTLGVSGVVGLGGGATIFLGVVEIAAGPARLVWSDEPVGTVHDHGADHGDDLGRDPGALCHHPVEDCAQCGGPHDRRLADLAPGRDPGRTVDGAGRRQARTPTLPSLTFTMKAAWMPSSAERWTA